MQAMRGASVANLTTSRTGRAKLVGKKNLLARAGKVGFTSVAQQRV